LTRAYRRHSNALVQGQIELWQQAFQAAPKPKNPRTRFQFHSGLRSIQEGWRLIWLEKPSQIASKKPWILSEISSYPL
jgi:hypothetical protein